MPAMTMTTMPATRSGVSTLPTTSMMRVGLSVSKSTTAKNATENGKSPMASPNQGAMAISKVVAAQRGGAMSMPTHRMAAVFSARPAFLPRAFWMERMEPPALLIANTPTQETTTSKNTKHARPSGHSSPDSMPRYGGKMRLPAPKNMANSAKPTTSASLFTGTSPLSSSTRTFSHLLSMNGGVMMTHRQRSYPPNAEAARNRHGRWKVPGFFPERASEQP